MKAQEYEDQSSFRIKFASIDNYGFLIRDSSEEYTSFFLETPQGWCAGDTDPVQTFRGDGHRAWLLRMESEEVLAVEHETGIEFLLAVGSAVASTAIVGLVSWAWQRWRNSRAKGIQMGAKAEPTLVLEAVEDRRLDGRIRISRKLELHGPIDQAAVGAAIRQWRAI
jgi:hypothetical protein